MPDVFVVRLRRMALQLFCVGLLLTGPCWTSSTALAGVPPLLDGKPLPSLAPMIETVTPAVVNISTRTRVQVRDPYFDDPMFRRFFGVPNTPRERVQQSLGSGVIVDAAKGYVLTNNHVIQGADDIAVTLHDNRTVKARVIGSDPDTDLTVLEIPAEGLSAVPLADSKQLRVGDFVVALGNPFGLGQTVTSGIVSALDRTGLGSGGYQNFIQTDASINPGNSGGALVNLRGELIGINSMIFSPSGASIGIGFAIPSDLAAEVMRQLIAYGEVRRGALGVETQDVTPQLATLLTLKDERGAVVTRVRAGTAAAAAGVQPGDVIVALNGRSIASRQDLHNLEGLTAIGTKVELKMLRAGKPLTLAMTLKATELSKAEGAELDPRLAGVQLEDLRQSAQRGGNATIKAIRVKQVQADSRAFASGLRAADLIVAVNQRDIDTVDALSAVLQQQPQQLLLTIVRGQRAFYLLLR